MTAHTATRPIVVGVESKQQASIRYALDEAERQKCGVRIVHAYAIPSTELGVFNGTEIMDASEADAQSVLNVAREFVESLGSSVLVEYSAQIGAPTRVLETESREASQMVLGPDDNAWYDRILVGDVGKRLVGHSHCPIIVVPESWDAREDRRDGVVVAVDGEHESHSSLAFAFAAADLRRSELHVMHVVPADTTINDAETHRLFVAETLAGWSAEYPDVNVLTTFIFGEIDESCITATKSADIVVVGRHQNKTLPFSLLRPVTTPIIKEANCPVAVVPFDENG